MPYKAHAARRHKIPKARYRVTNWPTYDRALQHRGSLTVWVTPEALAAWHPPRTGRRGRSPQYAEIAIETGHLLRLAFGRPWRQTEGLLRSLATLLGAGIGIPDHTTFSRRSPGLALASSLARAQARGPVQVVIEALVRKSTDGRGAAAIAAVQAVRRDTGLPSPAIRLSTAQATRASVFWLGRVRARRWRPMIPS
jgi:hypothetical protein